MDFWQTMSGSICCYFIITNCTFFWKWLYVALQEVRYRHSENFIIGPRTVNSHLHQFIKIRAIIFFCSLFGRICLFEVLFYLRVRTNSKTTRSVFVAVGGRQTGDTGANLRLAATLRRRCTVACGNRVIRLLYGH